jgi:penicillin-binding protein 1A
LIIITFWSFTILLTVGMGISGGFFFAYMRDLPNLGSLEEYRTSLITTVYSDRDEAFASFFEQKRIPVNLEKIPQHLKNGIIAVEDAQFYKHHGINMRGIARAVLTNLRAGEVVEGGSSITQQLAKVFFLTPEKSLSRKIKEAMLALEIERKFPKDKILELYCNHVYFGHGAYGVQAAAQLYFRKPVEKLSLSECATLAGLPRAPNYYSPFVDRERASKRRAHVLTRMMEERFITRDQAILALKESFDEKLFTRSRTAAPYFIEYLRQYLEEKYGSYAVYHGGLNVYSTLNVDMQKAAEESILGGLRAIDKARGYRAKNTAGPFKFQDSKKGRFPIYRPQPGDILEGAVEEVNSSGLKVALGRYKGHLSFDKMAWAKIKDPAELFKPGETVKVQVLSIDDKSKSLTLGLEQDPEIETAFLATDPRTGEIKTMIGGYDFGRSNFNRAIQAKRQPGSAFKPFVYAAAFDIGFSPSSIVDDSPITYHTVINGKLTDWNPQNYDGKFRGPLTLKEALAHSVNVATVRLIERVGVHRVIELAHQMGIKSELRPEYALALGVSEVSLIEMVTAFGVLANRGIKLEPFAIRKVTDKDGKILEEHFSESQQVIREETAYATVDAMKEVIEHGTAASARALGCPMAGKTGTTQDATDAWFIGFTPSLVAGVWIGYDTHRSLGPRITSANLALPIWINFMEKVLPGMPEEDFIPPGSDEQATKGDNQAEKIPESSKENGTGASTGRP